MKTFKQFIREQKESVAPQGVIFKDDKIAFVGEEHGTPIKLSSDILQKIKAIGEKYGYAIEWHPKPLGKLDWNGSGMHANFSNGLMRTSGDKAVFTRICEGFGSLAVKAR
jgi:glutamine synthetase type III